MDREKIWLFVIGVGVFLLIGVGLFRLRMYRLVKHTFVLMDTYVDIVIDKAHERFVGMLVERAKDLDNKLSFFSPSSCVSKLNREGKISSEDRCFSVLSDVIKISQEVWQETAGRFDPGFRGKASISGVQVSGSGIVIPQGGNFDFSGMAKGYIVDRVIEFARELGVDFIMVNAGGDIRVWDKRGVGVWVDVKNPQGGILDRVRVVNGAIATSGNYYRGEHIIDPQTKRKVSWIVSASAQHALCAVADAWATGLFVLGRKGLFLAERYKVGAMIGFLGEGGKIEIMRNSKWRRIVE